MRPSAFLAARRGDGSPPLPFPLSPRHAPHRGVGVHRGYRARPPVEEVHWGGGVGVVLFNILLLWGVYVFVIRRETSSLLDMLINAECALLLWGLYRILSGDPGIVACDSSYLEEAGCRDFVEAIYSSEKLPMLSRVRQCTWCKANIRGYDHHCPAFGTCIGQKNHRLFMALLNSSLRVLVGFQL